jgi:hypothetical protein
MIRDDQDECLRNQNRDSVTKLIRRRQQTQFVAVVRGFDAPRVDDDILRRRREGDE